MNAAKKGLPKVKPLLSREAANFIKKRRQESRRTMDTNVNSKQERGENQAKINEQELTRQVKSALELIEKYAPQLIKRDETSEINIIRQQQLTIDRIIKDIAQVQEQITRLRQIYNRPKVNTPAAQYSQQHLQQFSLASEISKQRQHLQLHIEQHTSIKTKTKEMHHKIKDLLPKYAQSQQKKGMKPISYGQFRKKAIAEKREKEGRMRMRSISSRCSSRSRASSVRSIISGKSEKQIGPEKRNMYHMQRRKSIALRAKQSIRKRYNKQTQELTEQLAYLRDQNGDLNIKIDQLTKQLALLQETTLNQSLASRPRSSTSRYG